VSDHIQLLKEITVSRRDGNGTLLDSFDLGIVDLQVRYKEAIANESEIAEVMSLAIALKRTELEKKLYFDFGGKVLGGVFKGMNYLPTSRGSLLMPKLLGTYEQEMASVLVDKAKNVESFLDIGCAEGYYVAGIAAKYPRVKSIGVDIDFNSTVLTSILCKINDVEGATFVTQDLACSLNELSGNVLVLVDVDGDEIETIKGISSFLEGTSKVGSLSLVIETDFKPDGASNAGDIRSSLVESGFKIEDTIIQNISCRFTPITAEMSFWDRCICGFERMRSEQAWIIANYDRGGTC